MSWKLSRLRSNIRKVLMLMVLACCMFMFTRTLSSRANLKASGVPKDVLESLKRLEVKGRQVKHHLERVEYSRDPQSSLAGQFSPARLMSSSAYSLPNGLSKQRDDHWGHDHYIADNMKEEQKNKHLHQHHGLATKHLDTNQLAKNSSKASNTTACLDWVKRASKPPYFLTAVLLVRIYKEDKAKLTTREMKEWLQYLRYAGVDHVYVYDAWVHEEESQRSALEAFEMDGFTTYIDWHTHNPYTISGTQVAAYQHCIDNYAHENLWQAAIDIDEYPFSPVDTAPGFLYRYVQDFSNFHPQVSEITMQNFLFLGKPLEKEMLMERLLRRTHLPANPLVKPIYKMANVRAQVHHNGLRKGRSMDAPSTELRMNHYWGARLQNWGEDTPEILSRTEPDHSIEPIIKAFKDCKDHTSHYLQ